MADDPFVKSPTSSVDLTSPWGFFVTIVTAVTTVAALSGDKIKLGPLGTFISAMTAFSEVRSIETGSDWTVDDHRVKEIIKLEGISESDAKNLMIFPLNETRLRKLVDNVGGVGWQSKNMIYAWHKDNSFVPFKTGRIIYRKNEQGDVEIRVHPSLLQKK